jgi:uncharacterized protein (DUF433 family)
VLCYNIGEHKGTDGGEYLMSRINWKDHIDIDPDLHHSDPCIRGTRIPVATIVGSLADGMTADEIIATYPQLTKVKVQAALAYAADVMRQELLLPFAE